MRSVIRRLVQEESKVERVVWEIDDQGYGRAVYKVAFGGYTYCLCAFSNQLDPADRTDRVIAEAWDASFALFDGIPTTADLDRLEKNAPLQEAGRFEASELVLSRANKSVRLFEHVAERLADGTQPDEKMIGDIGYLMRTTAVYGNGKFGVADREKIAGRPGMAGPFQVELLTVWLIRGFTHDLVEHVAKRRNPTGFVPLDRRLKRHLAIGNATGLGMAPFLVSHPVLINNWMMARETALAQVLSLPDASEEDIARMGVLINRVERHLRDWNVPDKRQMDRVIGLRADFTTFAKTVTPDWLKTKNPWARMVALADDFGLECQELVFALVLEPQGALIDRLTEHMGSVVRPQLDPAADTGTVRATIEADFAIALETDFDDRHATAQFWYVSEEKLEPRLGERFEEPGADLEMPLDIARQVKAMHADLCTAPTDQTVASFLLAHPQHRFAMRRVQTLRANPYSEIRDNLIGQDLLAIDMLRCKLSFFGASKFDPKSDRWTRITLYQGAPLFDEISDPDADDWWLPVLGASS